MIEAMTASMPPIRSILLVLVSIVLAPPDFTQFTYCRANPTSAIESLCIQLNPEGAGQTRFKRLEGEELRYPLTLSPGGVHRFLDVLAGTKNLADAKSYESRKKVADLGKKHLILETASGRREAEFNYSDKKEVTALVTFFEGLVTQEVLALDIQWAMQYDRLGVPERLDQIELMLKQSRLVDPKALMDVLDAVDQDDHIVDYARTHARELRATIAAGK
jgi:hypothetical protein